MKSPLNEKSLLEKAREGDGEAFGELVRLYEKFVYNTAYGFLLNADDAFDASQNAFLKAWRAIKGFKGESSFSTWLYRITANCAKDALYERNKKSVALSSTDDEGTEADIPVTDTPESQYIKKEEGEELRRAIEMLDGDSREIIVLRELSGLSYNEIANTLEVELGTVKSRLNRARARLREILLEQKDKASVK